MKTIHITLSILLPLVINLILTPIIIAYAHKKNLFDAKDHRKTHTGDIPRLGGIGIVLSLIISAVIIFLLTGYRDSGAFFIALILIFVSGVVDDFNPIRARVKLLAQIAATLILIVGGHTLSQIYIPFADVTVNLSYLNYPLTFIWIIGITNAINLLDGMDGQAGGVSTIAAATMGIAALLYGEAGIAATCFILTGALLGFLAYNFPPAKIFMGDSGSLTLGFFLAATPLLFQNQEQAGKMFLVAIAVMLIPIFDVFAAMIRRKRKHISFFDPDRGHIHHKFIDFTSLNTRQILSRIYGFAMLSGVLSILFITKTNTITVIGLVINVIIHLYLFFFLHMRKEERS